MKAIILPVSLRELDCILINSQSTAKQMIGTRTLHVAHLYWGEEAPLVEL